MKHFTIMYSTSSAGDEYRAICGVIGTNPKEFTRVTNPSSEGVTCPDCLEKLGRAVVMTK